MTKTAPTGAGAPVLLDLGPAAERVGELVGGITDEHLTLPTPCAKYRVREVIGHVIAVTAGLCDAGRKVPPVPPFPEPTHIVADLDGIGDWRTALTGLLRDLTAVWREPAAWEGMTQGAGFTFPAARAGSIALTELVVHGWDLAVATGLPYRPGTADLELSLAILAETAADRQPGGTFDPPVAVPAGAPPLDRVIGLSGRDPSWTP